jgi:cell wall-associated NlpC family hydrolase
MAFVSIRKSNSDQIEVWRNDDQWLALFTVGDLVFFDGRDDGAGLDHVGIYLGRDVEGAHHDLRGRSVLDGNRHDARTFRSTREI